MFFVKGMPPFGTGRAYHVHVFDSPDVHATACCFAPSCAPTSTSGAATRR
jgi:hypothetical protein